MVGTQALYRQVGIKKIVSCGGVFDLAAEQPQEKEEEKKKYVTQVESLQHVWERTARQRLFRGSYQSACSTERRPEPTQVVKPIELSCQG